MFSSVEIAIQVKMVQCAKKYFSIYQDYFPKFALI